MALSILYVVLYIELLWCMVSKGILVVGDVVGRPKVECVLQNQTQGPLPFFLLLPAFLADRMLDLVESIVLVALLLGMLVLVLVLRSLG